jgi:hypothetical protein
MTVMDPFASEQLSDGRIVPDAWEIIPSTLLDDSPTEVESGEIIIPGSEARLVVMISSVATLSPTSVIWSFLISYDGTNFFEIDGASADDWSAITVLVAAMPDTRAVMKGRIVAPWFKVKAAGIGTDGTNKVTVGASIARIPDNLEYTGL